MESFKEFESALTHDESAVDFYDQKSIYDSEEESSDEFQTNQEDEELLSMAKDLESQLDEILESKVDSPTMDETVEFYEHLFEELDKGRELPKVSMKQLQEWFPDFAPHQRLKFSTLTKPSHSFQKSLWDEAKLRRRCGRKEEGEAVDLPAPFVIEEDTTIYSVVPGLDEIKSPCFWDKRLPSGRVTEEEAKAIDTATDGLLNSLETDFHDRKRKRLCGNEDSKVLPVFKRMKLVSEKLCLEGVVLDHETEKDRTLAELMASLATDGFHETPEGRFLLRELRENNYRVKYTGLALGPGAERSLGDLVNSGRVYKAPDGSFALRENDCLSRHPSSEAERRSVAKDLARQITKPEFSETPIGQHLIKLLEKNDQLLQAGLPYLDIEGCPGRPNTTTLTYEDNFWNCDNMELSKEDWTRDVMWDEEDYERVKERPVTVDRALFAYAASEEFRIDPDLDEDDEPIALNTDTDFYSYAKTQDFQHSLPAQDMSPVIFPPIFSSEPFLRTFHRPKLRFRGGSSGMERVYPLSVHMEFLNKMKSKDQSVPQMQTLRDITGKEGDLVLMEFCEDHPPLMNEIGMVNKMVTYYLEGTETQVPELKYGRAEAVKSDRRLFFGSLTPGRCLTAVENNMYRAPVFEHDARKTDFLVIYSDESFFIREVNGLYAVGQECPLMEVPNPKCKAKDEIFRDYIDLYIIRLLWKSRSNPRTVKLDDLKRAFPSKGENYLRRRLCQWSVFHKHRNEWVLKDGLVPESTVITNLAPELYCAYKSMACAMLRLREEGYSVMERSESDAEDEDEVREETVDALRAAPWATTNAYVSALERKKCLLDAYKSYDPTDCGVGYLYVKVQFKPPSQKNEAVESERNANSSRSNGRQFDKDGIKFLGSLNKIASTDNDFRKLTLDISRKIVKKLYRMDGRSEEGLEKLSRFENVAIIRELSNKLASEGHSNLRFARPTASLLSDHKKKYTDSCQKAFDVQNRFLESKDISSDEEEEEDDEELQKMSKDFEMQLLQELEIGSGKKNKRSRDSMKINTPKEMEPKKPQKTITKLKIVRLFQDRNGIPVTKEEVLTNPELIRCYLKERQKLERNKNSVKSAPKESSAKVKRPNRSMPDVPPEDREKIRKEMKRARDRNRYQKQKENRQKS